MTVHGAPLKHKPRITHLSHFKPARQPLPAHSLATCGSARTRLYHFTSVLASSLLLQEVPLRPSTGSSNPCGFVPPFPNATPFLLDVEKAWLSTSTLV